MNVTNYLTHMLMLVAGQALMFINMLEVFKDGKDVDKEFISTVVITNVLAIVAGLLIVVLAQSF